MQVMLVLSGHSSAPFTALTCMVKLLSFLFMIFRAMQCPYTPGSIVKLAMVTYPDHHTLSGCGLQTELVSFPLGYALHCSLTF